MRIPKQFYLLKIVNESLQPLKGRKGQSTTEAVVEAQSRILSNSEDILKLEPERRHQLTFRFEWKRNDGGIKA